MLVVDLVVSNRIRRASTFELDRVGNLYRLYCRAFRLAENHNHPGEGDVRFSDHLSAGAGFSQATPHRFCSVCSPTSLRLKITSLLDIGAPVQSRGRIFDLLDHILSEEFMPAFYKKSFHTAFITFFYVLLSLHAFAQSSGSSGSINGSVSDPTGAVVPNAEVEIRNPVSGFDRSTTTDAAGKFDFTNIPFNPYHLTVTATGFASAVQDVEPRSSVPISVAIKLQVASSSEQVTVAAEGGD